MSCLVMDLTKDRQLCFPVDLHSFVASPVNLEIEEVCHLVSDNAGCSSCVQQQVDGAGLVRARQDGVLVNVYSFDLKYII